MGFRNNCYATVWEVQFNDKYADFLISISQKLPNGKFKNCFSGKVRFVGKAFEKVKGVNFTPQDKLRLLEVDVNTTYDKAKKCKYTSFICFDCELIDKEKSNEVEIIDTPLVEEPDINDLPF